MRLIRGELALINISIMNVLHDYGSRGKQLTLQELGDLLELDPVFVEAFFEAALKSKQDNDFYDSFLWVIVDPENEYKGVTYPPLKLLKVLFDLPDLTMDYIGDWNYHVARASDERKEWFTEEEKILKELEGYLRKED